MFESTVVELDGIEFTISDWSVIKTLKWQRRLAGKFGKSLPHLISNSSGLDGADVTKALDGILETLDEETLIKWLGEIIAGAQWAGKGEVKIEMFKGGTTLTLYKLAFEIVKWNLRDFLKGIQGVQKLLDKVTPKVAG